MWVIVINNLIKECNFEIEIFKYNEHVIFQSVYKFGNQFCYG